MRRLAVLTSDFSLFHDLVRFLRDRETAFDALAFGERPGPHVGVLVTSWRDALRSDLPADLPVVVVPVDAAGREDVATAVAQAQRILEGVRGYHELVIGVDPGKRPGIAVLGDGRVVHTAQVFAPRDVAPLVASLRAQFPSDHCVVRLGHGAPRERDEILRGLQAVREPEVRLELVDETGTTPAAGQRGRLPADVVAALRIARMPGRPPVRARRPISPGLIREIQRESREASEGRLTISQELARRVARGDLSLSEAVDRALNRRRGNPPSSR